MRKLFAITCVSIGVALLSLAGGEPVQSAIKAGDITGGEIAPHANIAAFHKVHGQESFKYPAQIPGADIIAALQGKAQYIFLNHTAGLKDGDVIVIGNDVLRESDGKFEDFGVDCQLSVHLSGSGAETSALSLGGMCEVLFVDKNHREIEHKLMIKPTDVQPGKGWILLYDDAEDGIAIYADVEIGLE